MIWDSYPWKVDLYKRAEWLKDKKAQRRWPESARVRVEQCIMIGCYCVRKLIEPKKLTDAAMEQREPVVVYKASGTPVHALNWHRLEELYDLESGEEDDKPLAFVCNQLVHSFVYINGFSDDGGLEFVMVCSDFERNRNLFRVSVDDLAEAFTAVANDDVVGARYEWNEKKQDYDHKKR